MEFWLEPRPDDRTDHTRAPLSRPSRHSKNNSRTRISLGREEPKDGHAFSPGGPSGSPACVLLPTAVHPSGLDEHGQ
uniref:Uncharacterized protein n=1 Tax=Brassica oleracea var. oleracea TaxID=109376 RepID=A0A0D3ABE8_BRAOL